MGKGKRILTNLAIGCCAVIAGPVILYAQDDLLTKEEKTAVQQAKARQQIADAEKAEADARRAARQADSQDLFGPLGNVTNSGNVTAGNTAGQAEVELLAAAAVQSAADTLGERLCRVVANQGGERNPDCSASAPQPLVIHERPRLPYDRLGYPACETLNYQEDYQDTRPQGDAWRPLVLVTQTDFTNFDVYDALMVRLTATGRNMCQAIDLARETTAQTAGLRRLPARARQAQPRGTGTGIVGGGLPIAAISTALSTFAGLVRTEYNFQGVSLSSNEVLLARETMLAFLRRRPNMPVFAPTLFPTTATAANNPVVRKLNVLDDIRRIALAEASEQAAMAQTLEAKRTTVEDQYTDAVKAAATLHADRRTAILAAITAYASLIETVSNPANSQPATLPTAMRQARAVQLMRQGGILVVTQTHRYGGSTLTRRNFFTAFGPMPFYLSGVALVGYTVMDGTSGQVLESGSIPVAGGFEQIDRLHDRFRPASAEPDRRRRRR